MKTFTNPPTDPAFFSANALTWKVAKSLVITGTIFGILTEFAISYGFLNRHITENLPATWDWVPYVIIAASVFLVVTLARERIRIGRQAARIVVSPQFRGLGKAANGVIIVAAVLVYGASIMLSYMGAVSGVTSALPAPTLVSTDNIAAATIAQTEAQKAQYDAARAEIEKQYDAQINAVKKQYNARIIPLEKQRKQYTKPADRAYHQSKRIDPLISERDEKLNKLREQKSARLLDLTTEHNTLANAGALQAQAERQTVIAANQSAANRHAWMLEKSQQWFPVVIIICLVLMVVGLYLEELFKHKAGMQEIEEPDEHDFLPPVTTELGIAMKRRFLGLIRNKIASFDAQTEQLDVEANMPELIRKQYHVYKERLIEIGADTHPAIASAEVKVPVQDETDEKPGKHLRRFAGFKQYPDAPQPEETTGMLHTTGFVENPVYTHNTPVYTPQVQALLTQYKVARRDYIAYLNKQRNEEGNPATIQAGINRSMQKMQQFEQEIEQNGFKIVQSRLRIYLEKM